MAVIRQSRNSGAGINDDSFNRGNLLTAAAKKQLKNTIEENFQKELGDASFLNDVLKEVKTRDDVMALADSAPEKMDFPFVMFFIALIVDVIDIFEVTGVAYFITITIKIIFTIILWFWFIGKLNGVFRSGSRAAFKGSSSAVQQQAKTASKQFLRKFLSRRAVAIVIVNFIPVISILASWAFFVFLAYNKHNKLAAAYIQTVNTIKINRVRKK